MPHPLEHRIFSRSPAAQNYSYRFIFSEDYRYADIQIRANCCCVCLVPPCAPAWCKVPDAITRFNAVQHESSGSGEYWVRNSSTCAGDCTAPATEPETFAMRRAPLSPHPCSLTLVPVARALVWAGKYSYDLVTVVNADGSPTAIHADLAKTAPAVMLISR